MASIKVPKTPQSSFDKNRRPSKLLLDQITHLEWAALPAWQRKPKALEKYKKKRVKTEQQAAERIAQLTGIIMQANKNGPQPVATGEPPMVILPPLPRLARAAKRVRTTKKVKTKKTKKTKRRTKKAKTVRRAKAKRGRR